MVALAVRSGSLVLLQEVAARKRSGGLRKRLKPQRPALYLGRRKGESGEFASAHRMLVPQQPRRRAGSAPIAAIRLFVYPRLSCREARPKVYALIAAGAASSWPTRVGAVEQDLAQLDEDIRHARRTCGS